MRSDWLKFRLSCCLGLSAAMLAGCSDPNPAPAVEQSSRPPKASVAPATRFAAVQVEQAKIDLGKEPKIIDLVFDPAAVVEWTIGVKDDGTHRLGYAEYVCGLLEKRDLVDGDTDVRVVDFDNFIRSGGDSHLASLGHVQCASGVSLGA